MKKITLIEFLEMLQSVYVDKDIIYSVENINDLFEDIEVC